MTPELEYLSLGLVTVSREQDGLMLDFLSHDKQGFLRVHVFVGDAEHIAVELQKIADQIRTALASEPPIAKH